MSEEHKDRAGEYEDLIRLSGQLVRIGLTEEEVRRLARNFRDFREHAEALKQVDVLDVEPATYLRTRGQSLRADAPRSSLNREEFLAGVPAHGNGYVKVAAVLDRDESES